MIKSSQSKKITNQSQKCHPPSSTITPHPSTTPPYPSTTPPPLSKTPPHPSTTPLTLSTTTPPPYLFREKVHLYLYIYTLLGCLYPICIQMYVSNMYPKCIQYVSNMYPINVKPIGPNFSSSRDPGKGL